MLNPITFTEKVAGDFLRYQLSTYGFADDRLNDQLRRLLSLEETRDTPLLKGPYISLSKSFRQGPSLAELGREGVLHPHMANLAPHPRVWGHQEEALRSIAASRTTLISTGTGSGKTECFLYPVISRCLELRDRGAGPGVAAVLVYPMNALAEDQLGRLRGLLAGTGISFGMYVGKTPERTSGVAGVRLPAGASREDYRREVEKYEGQRQAPAVHPPEERVSREQMRTPGEQPRILLTNVKQLELLLTRQQDYELFQGAQLDFLVFDEAHTFSGAAGAETACLIRRLRSYCGRGPQETVCVGTSATLADRKDPDAAKKFASRFFGVPLEQVSVVTESYEEDDRAPDRTLTPGFPGDPGIQLRNICEAVSGVEGETPAPGAIETLRGIFQAVTGTSLDAGRWQESLYDRLAANEVVYQIAQSLDRPRDLKTLRKELAEKAGREVPEEEILSWLALGAASSRDGRPLLRPVVHCFVQGVTGAVLTFPVEREGPQLWLSAEEASEAVEGECFRFPVMVCTTCGQHYFEHWLEDFDFTERVPGGGEAVESGRIWRPLEESRGGKRAVLVDRLAVGETEDEEEESPLDRRAAPVWCCRRCGTIHARNEKRCLSCGVSEALVELRAISFSEDQPEKLKSCLGCRAGGRRIAGTYREPARRLKATPVADVHVLAQSMIQHSERKRLLTFADNRQDAAFQAGWMQDHARRYRLRALMFERIKQGPVSIGDLTAWLDDRFEKDDDLSQALLPEVWRAARREAAGRRHQAERKRYLRIQVLRELTAGGRQRIGLEPWGRIAVDYIGLDAGLPFFNKWAAKAGCSAEELREGVAALLDNERRSRSLYDPELGLYSRYWHGSDREVQYGYIPDIPGGPKGTKLTRDSGDNTAWVRQWLSQRGDTVVKQAARRWGVPLADRDAFIGELWELLVKDLRLLAPVRLVGQRNPLPNCAGVRQVDADCMLIRPHRGVYRCNTCQRPHPRPAPKMACTVWRCNGTLAFETEDPDNYDLLLLDQEFAMLRAHEHSAQVPADHRERLERTFKSDSERLNTLVCTPTLELGVDIGALDSVLMRNIPPLPANYWQRVGRAGRRQRMAVNLTYARPASHDRSYFAEPLRILEGVINPPSINLKNSVMVAKHVRATMLTTLHKLGREGDEVSGDERKAVRQAVSASFPREIRGYLFLPAGEVRQEAFDLTPIESVVARHGELLNDAARRVFRQGWPPEDEAAVRPEALAETINGAARDLRELIGRLKKRLDWALGQMSRLDGIRARKGTLEREEEQLRLRCDRLVKKLKGVQTRSRQEAEGFDESNTFAVLAAEGFLPGYGLDTGWVLGYHLAPPAAHDIRDWELRRNTALALREYVPGNRIYANANRFVARQFHLTPEPPAAFRVDPGSETVREAEEGTSTEASALAATRLDAVPVCDTDLPHQSQISDEEDYRFQLPVAVYGYEQRYHAGGKSYTWGPLALSHRSGVRFRLVNVGAARRVRDGQLGYPVCRVCGQSRSPFASSRELDAFRNEHLERCGRRVEDIGFYADVNADALKLEGCRDRSEAFSLMEALRQGAAQVLEMEVEDLQPLAIGRPGEETADILLYDPMPGGSGLLDQALEQWAAVVAAAQELVLNCPSKCNTACVDCLLHYRNAHYHRHLDRRTAADRLDELGSELIFSHDIPAELPAARSGGETTNQAEEQLRVMLERAGFRRINCQHPIDLGRPLGVTSPKFLPV